MGLGSDDSFRWAMAKSKMMDTTCPECGQPMEIIGYSEVKDHHIRIPIIYECHGWRVTFSLDRNYYQTKFEHFKVWG